MTQRGLQFCEGRIGLRGDFGLQLAPVRRLEARLDTAPMAWR